VLFILKGLVRDGDTKVENSQVDLSCLLDMPIHIYFMIEFLVMLDNETFIGSVLVAI